VMRKLRPVAPPCAGGSCDWEGDMDGSFGEPESVVRARGRATDASATTLVDTSAAWPSGAWSRRLDVVRPGTALEARRRIVANDASTLQLDAAWDQPPRPGDSYEIRGSFDPSWVMRVPAAAHAASIRRFWGEQRNVCGRSRTMPCSPPAEPLDPLAPGNARGWSADTDRAALAALAAGGRVPALFGAIRDASPQVPHLTDPYPRVDSVVMDLRNPAYRAWRVRSLLYALQDLGVDPGAPACVILGYEPGLHARYDESEGPSTDTCALPGTASWQAPLHVCSDGDYQGGPLDPTAYGPGEFEAGVDALLRELLATLPRHGYTETRIVTAESASFRGRPWTVLAADLRFDARLAGELDRARPPLLASLPAAMPTALDDGGGGGGAAGAPAAWSGSSARSNGKGDASVPRRGWTHDGDAATETPRDTAERPRSERSGSSWSIDSGKQKPRKPRETVRASWRSASGSPSKPPKSSPTGSGGSVPGSDGPAVTPPRGGKTTPVATQPNVRPPPAPTPAPTPTPPTPTPSPTPTPTPARPAGESHEPPGLTPRWPMNPMNSLPSTYPDPPDRYGFMCWPDQCRTLSIVRDETSPGADPNVLRIGYPTSLPAGGHSPSRFLAGNDFGGKRRLYTSVYYYLSPNWTNNGNAATKFFFTRAGTDGVQNHYVSGPTWDPPYTSGIYLQSPDGNRNIEYRTLPVGRWVRMEVYLEMNTPGVANGRAKLWLDGELKIDESDVEWVARIPEGRTLRDVSWDHLLFDPTYGGGRSSPPEYMYFQIDDWYTSVGD